MLQFVLCSRTSNGDHWSVFLLRYLEHACMLRLLFLNCRLNDQTRTHKSRRKSQREHHSKHERRGHNCISLKVEKLIQPEQRCCFWQTHASSSSVLPFLIASLNEISSFPNKHTFKLPSAVIRSRLQLEQKCSVIEVMKPNLPLKPGIA